MTSPPVTGFRRRKARPVDELLVAATAAACHPAPHPRVAELAAIAGLETIGELPALAAAHRVEGCVHAVLEGVGGVDAQVLDRLAVGRRQASAHHLLVRDVLTRVGAVLDAAGIPWLVFKGPVLSSSVYCDSGMRRYSDLDVLVPPDRFVDAAAAMEDANYANSVTSWAPQVYFRSGAIAFSVGRISVDLHWHVVYKYQDRRWYSIDPDALFARRRTVDIAGQPCATFDAVDTLFHLALHAAREGCHRLVWLKDIELAVAVGQPDLDELVRRAQAAGCAPAIGIALARSKWLLGTPVPDAIVTALVGRVWPRAVRAVAAFDDLGSTSRWPSPGTVLTRETRMSILRTADRAVRRIAERGSERHIKQVLRRGVDRESRDPDEMARNQIDRAAYFTLVRDWRSELS
ncbi:MAG TPA: nucleotidyltransferase family protein [Ilumatobacteraceae bacterium]|nr:nucleotidyltransferase family protein [Ilumatobacteraceae bacterium]